MKELVSSIGALRGFELGSATVGLLGLGAVGRETARRLAGFGSRVIAHDPRVDDEHFAALGVTRVDLNTLFSESDVLSLHAAVTKETRGIVSEARIAQMKPGAFLINTARHQLVDGDALYAALAEGRLGGAGLDVFKSEPPTKDDPFLKLPNVVAMPHLGRRHSRRRAASDRDGRGGPRSHPARRAPPPHRQPGRARLRSDGPALSRLRRRHRQRSSGRLRRGARGSVAAARRPWRARAPAALAPFGRELDPEAVWEALLDAADEALAKVDRGRVRAVAATGQRIACAFLDEAGETLYLGPNRDIRALAGADLSALDEEALFASSGRFPPWIFAPGRALWFAAEQPEVHAKIRVVLGLPDWVAHRLSGERATDPTTAADLMLFDVARETPDANAIEAARLPPDALPPVRAPGTELGALRPEVAARLGLGRRGGGRRRRGHPARAGGARA